MLSRGDSMTVQEETEFTSRVQGVLTAKQVYYLSALKRKYKLHSISETLRQIIEEHRAITLLLSKTPEECHGEKCPHGYRQRSCPFLLNGKCYFWGEKPEYMLDLIEKIKKLQEGRKNQKESEKQ